MTRTTRILLRATACSLLLLCFTAQVIEELPGPQPIHVAAAAWWILTPPSLALLVLVELGDPHD